MDYRLLFTQRALSDLSEIVAHIPEDDEEAASRFGEALVDHVDLLGRFPRMEKRQVEILHFRHGSRKPPKP